MTALLLVALFLLWLAATTAWLADGTTTRMTCDEVLREHRDEPQDEHLHLVA